MTLPVSLRLMELGPLIIVLYTMSLDHSRLTPDIYFRRAILESGNAAWGRRRNLAHGSVQKAIRYI